LTFALALTLTLTLAFALTLTFALTLAFTLTFAFPFALAFKIHMVLSQRLKSTPIFLKKIQQKKIMDISGIHKLMVKNTISMKMKLMVRSQSEI
jgi:hypothetical protein